MIILDMLAAFIIAAMSGLGIGGGGLLVIYFSLLRSFDQLAAQGINILFFIISALSSFVIHAKKRRINLRLLVFVTFFGIIGVFASQALLAVINPEHLRKYFGALMALSGAVALFKKR